MALVQEIFFLQIEPIQFLSHASLISNTLDQNYMLASFNFQYVDIKCIIIKA